MITLEERNACVAFLLEVAEWARVRNMPIVRTERTKLAEMVRAGVCPINKELLRAGRRWLRGRRTGGFEKTSRTDTVINPALGP